MKKKSRKSKDRIVGTPSGWSFDAPRKAEFEVGLDKNIAHSGTQSAYMCSKVKNPKPFAYLMQCFNPHEYLGKRLRMSAWVKTKSVESACQLWIRVDVEGRSTNRTGVCHDNMADRPIQGSTDWTQYDLVVDVPKKSYNIDFGLMLLSSGEAWLDDITFESVSNDVPLTSPNSMSSAQNLDFEDR